MRVLEIGLAQCRQTDNLETNAETVFRFIDTAARAEVHVLCFPETQTGGYRVDIATRSLLPVQRSPRYRGRRRLSGAADRGRGAGLSMFTGSPPGRRC
jgi:predicted amidohydrolase